MFELQAVLLVSVLLAAVATLTIYQLGLPKPIPGIPYDKEAAGRVCGHVNQLLPFQKANHGLLHRHITTVSPSVNYSWDHSARPC